MLVDKLGADGSGLDGTGGVVEEEFGRELLVDALILTPGPAGFGDA